MEIRNSSRDRKANLKNSLRFEKAKIDRTDAAILRALWADARISHAALARRVGMSAPSVADRVRRLEDTGVIAGYGARIDPAALGYGLTVLIRARPLPGAMKDMIEAIRATEQIVSCERISGEDCFIARAHVHDVAEMEEVIDRIIPFGATSSSIVQSLPVEERLMVL